MQVSDKGLMALIGHEGIVQSRYRDAVGVWTIGVGHTKAAGGINPEKFVGSMSIRQVFDLLRQDVAKYAADVSKVVKVPLEQHEFDALVSWHFNTGKITKSPKWLPVLNRGDKKAAGKMLARSIITAKGKVLPALEARRKDESALFLTGVYPRPFANLYPASPSGKVLWSEGKRIDLTRALQIDAKPPAKPVESQKPAPAPTQPGAPPPAPQATPAPKGDDYANDPADGMPEEIDALAGLERRLKIIKAAVAAIIAGGIFALGWLAALPCNLFGIWCGG